MDGVTENIPLTRAYRVVLINPATWLSRPKAASSVTQVFSHYVRFRTCR